MRVTAERGCTGVTFPRSGRRADSLGTQMREQEVSEGTSSFPAWVFFREQGSQEGRRV